MNEIKALLYDSDFNTLKSFLSKTKSSEDLYLFAYNYNWENGFEIPKIILNNEKCELSIALLIFYRADGFRFLMEKSQNSDLPQWSCFIKQLYDSILDGKYKKGVIGWNVPLSKIQSFKLQKMLSECEKIFIENIAGKNLDIDL